MNLTEKRYVIDRIERLVQDKIKILENLDKSISQTFQKEVNDVVSKQMALCNGFLVLPKSIDVEDHISPVSLLPSRDYNKCVAAIKKISSISIRNPFNTWLQCRKYGITGPIKKANVAQSDVYQMTMELPSYVKTYYSGIRVNYVSKFNFDKAEKLNELLINLVDMVYVGDSQDALNSIKAMENFKI